MLQGSRSVMEGLYTYITQLQLPTDIQEKLDPWRKSLKKEIDVFSVPKIRPHITLMRMTCHRDDEDAIVEDLKKISHEPIKIEGTHLEKISRSSVAIMIKETDAIHTLHEKIANVFSERMARPPGHVPPEYQDRIEDFQKYGSPFFGEHYKPHLTIGYTGGTFPEDISLPFPIEWETKRFKVCKKLDQSGKPYQDVVTISFN